MVASEDMRPLYEVQGVILDLDGTVYRGNRSIPGASAAVERMLEAGLQIVYLSNNASDTRKDVTDKLERHGLPVASIPVITGTSLLAAYLYQHSRSGRVLIVGEAGLAEEIRMVGWEGVMAGSKRANSCAEYDAVAVGCDRYFSYEKLDQAYQAIVRGAYLVATDRDSTYPTETGAMPGTGAVLTGIEFASSLRMAEMSPAGTTRVDSLPPNEEA
jgi:HAD superfamily hydrolase (TIGR01450 family)